MKGSAPVTLGKLMSTSPAITAVVASGAPRYGTCSIFTSVIILKTSPAKCAELPTPGVLNVSLPGCDRAKAISPLTSRTGTDGCTASANDVITTMDTGAKSRSTLYGSLGRNAGRIVVEPAA